MVVNRNTRSSCNNLQNDDEISFIQEVEQQQQIQESMMDIDNIENNNSVQADNVDNIPGYINIERFAECFPSFKESDAWRVIQLYFEHKQLNETKIHSFNRLIQETIPRIIRNLPPMVVKHGFLWHQFKFLDVVMQSPIQMNADGQCRMAVPQECLKNGIGYNSDIFVHTQYNVYHMECVDGSRSFVSRKQQQAQQKSVQDAAANEGMNNLNNVIALQKQELNRLKQQLNSDGSSTKSNRVKNETKVDGTQNIKSEPQPSSAAALVDKSDAVASDNAFHKLMPASVNIEPSDDELIAKYGHIKEDSKLIKYVRWFDLPIMLKSVLDNMVDVGGGQEYGECPHDAGGNVITNSGVEKVIMFREKPANNQITVQHKKDGTFSFQGECRSEHSKKYRSTSTLYMKYMNRVNQNVDGSPILVQASILLDNIPWVILMRALGIESDDEIRDLFWHTAGPAMYKHAFYMDILERCLDDNRECFTTAIAINRLGRLVGGKTDEEQRVMGLRKLKQEIFPHLGYTEADFLEKARFLCNMMHQVLDAVEENSQVTTPKDNIWISNRDSYFNKRMELPEELLAGLIRQYIINHLQTMVKPSLLKKLDKCKGFSIYETFDMETITKGLNYNLAMGNWHATPGKNSQTGVSQNMARYNFNDTIDQHHKILNPIHKEGGKHIEPRLLDDSSYGVSCVHSPDGDQVGLVRFEAIFNHMTMGTDPDVIIHLLLKSNWIKPYSQLDIRGMVQEMENGGNYLNRDNGWTKLTVQGRNEEQVMEEDEESKSIDFVHVCVNQRFIGVAPSIELVREKVIEWRRKMVISVDVGISRAIRKGKHIIDIRTEVGRNAKPLFVLENFWKLDYMDLNYCRWEDLIQENIIEYIDVQEQIELLIAPELRDAEKSVIEWHKEHPHEPYPFHKDYGTYSHAELHGCSMYGLSPQFIPFSNFNAAVRNTFQSGQGKQAQGKHSVNAGQRFDTSMSEMWLVLKHTLYIL